MVNPPTVIVLAAGEGSRIGMPKAMLRINGRCFLERIIDTLIIAGIEEIIVVLGAEAENIKSMTDLSIVNVVINENYQDGQFSSLQCGLDELEFPGDVLVFPVDHPLVMPKTVSTIVDSISNGDYQTASVPVH
ncbi:MAG: NTP transferase domain-containing protein, partial [candidate division Zixibacteria bacterium]|nr:NTP transferase domain-containing protein [candidate division Zixibacteria bacterium]